MVKGIQAFVVAFVLGIMAWGMIVFVATDEASVLQKATSAAQQVTASHNKLESQSACLALATDRFHQGQADLLGCANWDAPAK